MRKLFSLGLAVALLASSPVRAEGVAPLGYDRVIASQTLRCGYGSWQPGVYKDANSGEMKGLFVELINTLGKLSDLKVEWTAETDWGQIAEAIRSGKIDAFCAGMANDAARGKVLAYSLPLSFWSFDVLVRAEDKRFPVGDAIPLASLNNPAYATAYSEGDVLETIAKSEFPAVKGVALPPLGTPADNLMNVVTKKTDFVVFPKVMFQSYEKQNPGVLRHLRIQPALRVYGNVIAVGIEDLRLQQLLNAGVTELVNSGSYAEIMARYDQLYPGAFLPVQPAYRLP